MSETAMAWARFVLFVAGLLCAAALLGYLVYTRFVATDATIARTDSQTLALIQVQLTGVEKRLGALESRRKADSAKALPDVKTPETAIPGQGDIPRAPRARYQVSPESALPSQPLAVHPPLPDPASAQR